MPSKHICCFCNTIHFYILSLIFMILGVLFFVYSDLNFEFDSSNKVNLIGGASENIHCGKNNFEDYQTFHYIRHDTNFTYQCGYKPTTIYLTSISFLLMICVTFAMFVLTVIFKRGSYSFGLFLLGIIIALYVIVVIVLQIIELIQGNIYCEESLIQIIGIDDDLITCKPLTFIIPVILEFLAVICLFVNPIIGCKFLLVTKPYVPLENNPQENEGEVEMQDNQDQIRTPIGDPAI
ncbi:Transmembrane protein [Entamoeba marina]